MEKKEGNLKFNFDFYDNKKLAEFRLAYGHFDNFNIKIDFQPGKELVTFQRNLG